MRATPARPEDLLAHADFVRGLARSLLWGEEGVDDVVQDAWAAGLATPPRDPRAARSWLGTVVRNLVRQRFRSETRRRAREESASRSESVPSTQDVLAREEERRRVVEAVLALHPPSREVVLLRYFEDLPPREIARRLGEPVETVRTRLKRALAELRARLDEGRGGDRRAWAVLLVPLASGGGRIGEWGAGGLAMGAAAKAAAGVAAAAILGAAWWAWPREVPLPGGAPATNAPAALAKLPAPAEGVAAPPVPVPAAPSFHGRVLDATTRQPLAAARVRGFDLANDASLGEVPVSEQGEFALPAGTATRATLRLIAPGYEALERRGAALDAVLTLRARRLCTLTVRVRDSRGDPVSGAEAALWSDGVLRGTARSDAEGRAVLADLVPDDFLLGVHPPPDRTDLTEGVERPSLAPGETREVPVVLDPGTSCVGTVVDAETGNPLPGARILTVRGMQHREQTADAEGRFPYDHARAGKPNLGAIVLVGADGYETVDHQFRPAVDREFTVRLQRAVSHRFRVVGIDGTPVPGVRVVAYGTRRLPPVPVGEAITDDAGACSVPGFSMNENHAYIVEAATADGHARASFEAFEGTPNGLRETERIETAIPIRLAPFDRAITVRVRRGDEPVEGARVRVGWVPERRENHFAGRKGAPPRRPILRSMLPAASLWEGDAAPDGTIRFGSMPRGTLSVEVDGHAARGWLVSTRDGDATLEIDLSEAVPDLTVVRGVVRTAEGPLPGAFVHILDSEGRMRDGGPAGKDGRFQISTQRGPPWGLRVSISAPDGSVRLVDFPAPAAGEEADLLVR